MKLIVGLGNPGREYANTRHNVGWLVLDALKQEFSKKTPSPGFKFQKKLAAEICKLGNLILAKPQTFMNDSGESVKKLITHFKMKLPNLWVIHDDLDICLGEYKIQFGKGPREHNGLLSIYEKLGTKNFWHVRLGVDNREPENRISGEEYVLQNFSKEEFSVIQGVIEGVTHQIKEKLACGM